MRSAQRSEHIKGTAPASSGAVHAPSRTTRILIYHPEPWGRLSYLGRVGVVTVAIPAGGEGMIRYEDIDSTPVVRAHDIGSGAIAAGQEICIERIEDGVAHVELWALIEERLF